MITNILTNAFTLREAWCKETSADPEHWTPENPAWGQCAVTALVIQDIFGGKLMRRMIDGGSHYYNILDNGTVLDYTLEQFAATAEQGFQKPEERDRKYVLSYPATKRRYEMLKERMVKIVYIPEPDDDKNDGGVL